MNVKTPRFNPPLSLTLVLYKNIKSALKPFILRYKSANIQIATDQKSEVTILKDKVHQLTNGFHVIGELNNG